MINGLYDNNAQFDSHNLTRVAIPFRHEILIKISREKYEYFCFKIKKLVKA